MKNIRSLLTLAHGCHTCVSTVAAPDRCAAIGTLQQTNKGGWYLERLTDGGHYLLSVYTIVSATYTADEQGAHLVLLLSDEVGQD